MGTLKSVTSWAMLRVISPEVQLKTFTLALSNLSGFQVCSNCFSRNFTAKHVMPHKGKGKVERENYFVDYVKVHVIGGQGGNGKLSFSSLPRVEWAGPDGGNGGHGGHVIFKASHNAKSLAHLSETIRAPNGIKGNTKNRDGKNAPHRIIEVPLGTVIKSESGKTLASLGDNDEMFVAARGGAGGKGNYFFLSNENRAPSIAEEGALGQERIVHVELKTMADAGLIGFPNAGKSSLLRAISRAQPKVSAYPFTTLNPHIGMVKYDDHEQIAVADIPGLIPGAHQNKGLGISFLRHIERCLCLIYVIDLSVEKPWTQLEQLRFELDQYQPGLSSRPSLLVCNKIDLPGANEKLESIREAQMSHECERSENEPPLPVFGVSAKKLLGIEDLLQYLKLMCDNLSRNETKHRHSSSHTSPV